MAEKSTEEKKDEKKDEGGKSPTGTPKTEAGQGVLEKLAAGVEKNNEVILKLVAIETDKQRERGVAQVADLHATETLSNLVANQKKPSICELVRTGAIVLGLLALIFICVYRLSDHTVPTQTQPNVTKNDLSALGTQIVDGFKTAVATTNVREVTKTDAADRDDRILDKFGVLLKDTIGATNQRITVIENDLASLKKVRENARAATMSQSLATETETVAAPVTYMNLMLFDQFDRRQEVKKRIRESDIKVDGGVTSFLCEDGKYKDWPYKVLRSFPFQDGITETGCIRYTPAINCAAVTEINIPLCDIYWDKSTKIVHYETSSKDPSKKWARMDNASVDTSQATLPILQ